MLGAVRGSADRHALVEACNGPVPIQPAKETVIAREQYALFPGGEPVKQIVVLRWGGGVNSTALAAGLAERGERPDYVFFSDTGDEKRGTYAYQSPFGQWLARVGFPPLTIRSYRTEAGDTTLEGYCLRVEDLPSRVYGSGACAEKWKLRPMEKWSTHEPAIKALRAAGGKPCGLIGYDAGEARRDKLRENGRWIFRAPLIEWGWDRDECVRAIERAGLPIPPKSSCFHCPASKKPEILRMAKEEPDLMRRALAMEDRARASGNLVTIRGLGRSFSWREFLEADEATRADFPEAPVEACVTCADDSCDRDDAP